MIKIIRATTVPQSLNVFCKGILQELSEKYEVVGLSSPGKELEEVARREGVRVIAVPMERHISLTKDLKSLFQMIRVFYKEKPYVIHSMTPKAGLLCMIAGWMTRVPIRIHTFTGLVWPTSKGVRRKVLMLTDKITCACATHIIPEGEGVKNDLISGKITKKPLKVLGYGNVMGVDMERFSRRPKVMEMANQLRDDNKFTFVFVGRLVKNKGINELCKAYERIHNQYPNTRCWLIGPYEDNLDPINAESRRLIEALNNGLVAVGRKSGDELLAYYVAADCFVMPSYREGFPNTVMEAGALGLPSIVTDINGSREIIKDGINGMIVPPQNEDRLYQAMAVMITSNLDRKKMADNARKMILDRFEQSYVRKCLYDFYDEVIK